jgi:hypothetical protein
LYVLLAAVGMVLLIGCVYLANLTLARGTDAGARLARPESHSTCTVNRSKIPVSKRRFWMNPN